ncbi:MAG: coenzyme F420-0:L-glutamate ligase [Thaumarchaeota archaeon]|nr:coenzyme F420-0:L-glutamate ligase [Nitrososphaerota archaeon]MDG6908242.1 coenzyme F420-0:L-glutamate ligase [Nitrososphaerota archaeon]
MQERLSVEIFVEMGGAFLKQISLYGLQTIPEVESGDDLAVTILEACAREGVELWENDILIITSKIVSKAENSIVDLSRVVPSRKARSIAKLTGKDPVEVEIILGEVERITAVIPVKKIMKSNPEIAYDITKDKEAASRAIDKVPAMLLTRTKNGLLATDAGLDYSNNPEGSASLLPRNPTASAKKLREDLKRISGKNIAVVITDTEISYGNLYGSTEVAIGYSGIYPVSRLFGSKDRFGREKFGGADVTVDELACASALIEGQTCESIPVVIVRGLDYEKGDLERATPTGTLERGIRWVVLATIKLWFARLLEPFVQ